ncbi:hypothetical protein FOL47_010589 [Perkinsus chesapeaki]|uniref:SET domain-containing protein n=1 Tax=Perkinsus chesapeaki TaxID=330153 RepID=A0A7J6MQ45_PERCH|nr:hypothetical protein FOL47_010589 [Perkinsus chesapeaki]
MSIEYQDHPNDIITLQFGRASNHVGSHYWNIEEACEADEMATKPLYRGKKPRALMCDFNKAVGTHFVPGDYGMNRDGYYYAARDDLDWSETALRRLLESCDRLDTIQSLFDVSTSFTGDCVSAIEWLGDEVPKKDVIFVPLETLGQGSDAAEWCLNFAYSICQCVASDSTSLKVLGCIPSGLEALGSIIDNERLYKRTSPIALSLHALTYPDRVGNGHHRSYKSINAHLADWGILAPPGDHQWEYHIDKVHLPEAFPRAHLGLSEGDQFLSVSTTLDANGPSSRRQISRCLSDLKKLRSSGNLSRCIANSNGVLEADTIDEFETVLKDMTDQKATAANDECDDSPFLMATEEDVKPEQHGHHHHHHEALLFPMTVDELRAKRAAANQRATAVLDHVADLLRKQYVGMSSPTLRTRIEPEVIFSANVFFRRFFTRHSVLEFDPLVVIFSCVSLACKTEEFHDTDVRGIMLMADVPPGSANDGSSKYVVDPKILAEVELDLLSGLDYDLVVEQPWPPLLLICRKLVASAQLDRPTSERIFRHASELLTLKWSYCDAVATFPAGTLAACSIASVWSTVVANSTAGKGIEVVCKIISEMGAEEGATPEELESSLRQISVLFDDFEKNRSDPIMFDPTLMMQLVKYRQKFERTRLRTLAGEESRASSSKASKRKSSKSGKESSGRRKRSKKDAPPSVAPTPSPSVVSSPDASQLVASDFFPEEAKPRFRYAGFWPGIFNHAGTPEVERMQKVDSLLCWKKSSKIFAVRMSPSLDYYTKLISAIGSEDLHLEARNTDDRGVGLYATETLEAGETLWAERPLLGALVRSYDRPLCVCETCGRFVGSLQLQLKFGLGSVDLEKMAEVFEGEEEAAVEEWLFTPELPKVPKEGARLTEETPCVIKVDNDILLFCSVHCRDGFENVHRPLWATDAGRKIRQVAREHDMEYLLLAAKVVLGFFGADDDLREGVRRLCGGDQSYWDCVDMPDDSEEANRFVEDCKCTLKKGAEAMTELVANNGDAETKKLATFDGLNGLLGKLCRNAIMVTYPNPLTEYLLAISQVDADVTSLRDLVRDVKPVEEEGDDEADDFVEVDLGEGVVVDSRSLCPHYRGWAVFPLLSCVNHSCRPNVETEFSGDGATLVANVSEAGSIGKGDELTISYCDVEEDSAEERQKQLDAYGFTCQCERCCKKARRE